MNTQSKSILIVEDDNSLHKVLHNRFEQEGFTVYDASNGQEALEFALKNHPDLILLDVIMPKMDGMSMIKKLREDGWGKKAKVIILTNLSPDDNMIDNILVTEPSYYLVKSNSEMDDIVNKVKEVLGS